MTALLKFVKLTDKPSLPLGPSTVVCKTPILFEDAVTPVSEWLTKILTVSKACDVAETPVVASSTVASKRPIFSADEATPVSE